MMSSPALKRWLSSERKGAMPKKGFSLIEHFLPWQWTIVPFEQSELAAMSLALIIVSKDRRDLKNRTATLTE